MRVLWKCVSIQPWTGRFGLMSEIVVEGGSRLTGTVKTLGAKNAVLKEIVATLLAPGRHHLTNVPSILDVALMSRVLEHTDAETSAALLSRYSPDVLVGVLERTDPATTRRRS